MVISLLFRNGLDSIISKVCSNSGWDWSISSWVPSSSSKILTYSEIRVFYANISLLKKKIKNKKYRRSNAREAGDILKPYIPSRAQSWKVAIDRPFPSSLVPLFQSESKCETFHMKMSSACSFFFMQIKVIFIRMVSHLNSLWNRGTRELGNGLLDW